MQRLTSPRIDLSMRSARVRAARIVAIMVDVLQIAALPVFAPGVLSPVNNALDVITAFVMVRLLGWHWGFLPSFVAELVPGLDLIPTWTAAVFLATRREKPAEQAVPPVLDSK